MQAYRGPPFRHRFDVRLQSRGSAVGYTFRGAGRFQTGGGPYYVIDSNTGAIQSRKYYR